MTLLYERVEHSGEKAHWSLRELGLFILRDFSFDSCRLFASRRSIIGESTGVDSTITDGAYRKWEESVNKTGTVQRLP